MLRTTQARSPCSGHLLLLTVTLFLCQDASSVYIRTRPNTFKEFQLLKCRGEFDKGQYSSLTQICDDCYNLFRNPNVLLECTANCFNNPIFPKCVSWLMMDDQDEELRNKVYNVSGKRPHVISEIYNSA